MLKMCSLPPLYCMYPPCLTTTKVAAKGQGGYGTYLQAMPWPPLYRREEWGGQMEAAARGLRRWHSDEDEAGRRREGMRRSAVKK
jgi:hypothetical protein